MYKTPNEAICAYEAEFEESWKKFLEDNKLNSGLTSDSQAIGKIVFRAGYMAGAKFVTNAFISKIKETQSKSESNNL